MSATPDPAAVVHAARHHVALGLGLRYPSYFCTPEYAVDYLALYPRSFGAPEYRVTTPGDLATTYVEEICQARCQVPNHRLCTQTDIQLHAYGPFVRTLASLLFARAKALRQSFHAVATEVMTVEPVYFDGTPVQVFDATLLRMTPIKQPVYFLHYNSHSGGMVINIQRKGLSQFMTTNQAGRPFRFEIRFRQPLYVPLEELGKAWEEEIRVATAQGTEYRLAPPVSFRDPTVSDFVVTAFSLRTHAAQPDAFAQPRPASAPLSLTSSAQPAPFACRSGWREGGTGDGGVEEGDHGGMCTRGRRGGAASAPRGRRGTGGGRTATRAGLRTASCAAPLGDPDAEAEAELVGTPLPHVTDMATASHVARDAGGAAAHSVSSTVLHSPTPVTAPSMGVGGASGEGLVVGGGGGGGALLPMHSLIGQSHYLLASQTFNASQEFEAAATTLMDEGGVTLAGAPSTSMAFRPSRAGFMVAGGDLGDGTLSQRSDSGYIGGGMGVGDGGGSVRGLEGGVLHATTSGLLFAASAPGTHPIPGGGGALLSQTSTVNMVFGGGTGGLQHDGESHLYHPETTTLPPAITGPGGASASMADTVDAMHHSQATEVTQVDDGEHAGSGMGGVASNLGGHGGGAPPVASTAAAPDPARPSRYIKAPPSSTPAGVLPATAPVRGTLVAPSAAPSAHPSQPTTPVRHRGPHDTGSQAQPHGASGDWDAAINAAALRAFAGTSGKGASGASNALGARTTTGSGGGRGGKMDPKWDLTTPPAAGMPCLYLDFSLPSPMIFIGSKNPQGRITEASIKRPRGPRSKPEFTVRADGGNEGWKEEEEDAVAGAGGGEDARAVSTADDVLSAAALMLMDAGSGAASGSGGGKPSSGKPSRARGGRGGGVGAGTLGGTAGAAGSGPVPCDEDAWNVTVMLQPHRPTAASLASAREHMSWYCQTYVPDVFLQATPLGWHGTLPHALPPPTPTRRHRAHDGPSHDDVADTAAVLASLTPSRAAGQRPAPAGADSAHRSGRTHDMVAGGGGGGGGGRKGVGSPQRTAAGRSGGGAGSHPVTRHARSDAGVGAKRGRPGSTAHGGDEGDGEEDEPALIRGMLVSGGNGNDTSAKRGRWVGPDGLDGISSGGSGREVELVAPHSGAPSSNDGVMSPPMGYDMPMDRSMDAVELLFRFKSAGSTSTTQAATAITMNAVDDATRPCQLVHSLLDDATGDMSDGSAPVEGASIGRKILLNPLPGGGEGAGSSALPGANRSGKA